MTRPKLDSLRIEGFLSIRSTKVELGDLNVLVGANGAGKSNFIAALELLGRLTEQELGLYVGLRGGASSLLHAGGKNQVLNLELVFGPNLYEVVLIPSANDGLIFSQERVFRDGPHREDSRLGRGHRETGLHDEFEQRGQGSAAAEMLDLLGGCRVFHFHDTSANAPVKQYSDVSDNVSLRPDAANLAAFLLWMREARPRDYRRVILSIQQVAPFFRDFVLVPELNQDKVRLRWRQEGSDGVFSGDALSDGTLRFVCLSTLLLQPDPPALIVLDEPELGLHPFAIVQLAEMLRVASRESQVLIATQSVTLMNQFELDDLIVAEREHGATVFTRPVPERLTEWLEEYGLGEMWEKNLLGGRPRPERA
jgi:predicted ATPase